MHLLARWVLHPPGTERALSSSSEETSRVWRGPKTLGLRPISASSARATRRLLLARANRPRHGHGTRRLALTATRRPHAFQSVSAASRQQLSLDSLRGSIAVRVDRDVASCLSLRTRTPKQNPRARSSFCLVPLAKTTQFSVPRFLRNTRSSERQPPSSGWPPFRTGPSAVCRVVEGQTWAASTGAGGSFLTSTPLAVFASV